MNKMVPLPNVSKDIKVKSFSNPSLSYTLNLSKMTCTCPDFTKRHAKFEKGTIERLCKHLKLELSKETSIKGSIFEPLLSDKHDSKSFLISDETESIIGYSESNEWINVYAKSVSLKFDKFGYSIDEHRWSRDNLPASADAIENIINEVIVPIIEDGEPLEDDEASIDLNPDELESAMRELRDLLDSIINDSAVYEMGVVALNMVMLQIKPYITVPPYDELLIAMNKTLENENYTKPNEREKLFSVIKDVRKRIK